MNIKYQNSNIKIINQKSPPQRLADSPKSLVKKIISNKKIKDNYFEIIVEAPEIVKSAQPGQFVNIKVSDGIEPLLRRPLSIHKIRGQGTGNRVKGKAKDSIVLLYEAVGKGTEILSRRKSGEFLDVIGPLGKGFNVDCGLSTVDRRPILVAGGMGTAPLVFLAEEITGDREQGTGGRIIVLIGAKTKKDILCEDEFKKLGCKVRIATDDGSRGFKGYVSDLLENLLRTPYPEPRTLIYACGPAPMLKEISRISQEHNIPAQLSLESHMACGIGACMGCVVRIRKPKAESRKPFEYKRVCKEGPVFEANQILWE